MLSIFPGFYPILHSEHDALVLIDLIPCLDNMGDISFSALIHSLMNFYSGTTQAGDNKFVSLMLVCARHMAKAGTQWGCKRYMNMKHLEAALDDALLPADLIQPEPAKNFAHKS